MTTRRESDRTSLLPTTMGSPPHRYPLRHKRGMDKDPIGGMDGTFPGLPARLAVAFPLRSVSDDDVSGEPFVPTLGSWHQPDARRASTMHAPS